MPPDDTKINPDAILAGAQPHKLHLVPIALSMDPPEAARPGFAEQVCLRLAAHPDPNVRGNAILGFGHLARILGRFDAPEAVHAAVFAALGDPDRYVSGQAHAATGDLRHFMEWTDLPE